MAMAMATSENPPEKLQGLVYAITQLKTAHTPTHSERPGGRKFI